MTLDEAIKHCEEVADVCEFEASKYDTTDPYENSVAGQEGECASEHRQLAKWLKELRVFKSRKGQWLRMSDLSEQEDDRYKCSHCGNVIHHKNKMDLYTFNSWCGRCVSNNGRMSEGKNGNIQTINTEPKA